MDHNLRYRNNVSDIQIHRGQGCLLDNPILRYLAYFFIVPSSSLHIAIPSALFSLYSIFAILFSCVCFVYSIFLRYSLIIFSCVLLLYSSLALLQFTYCSLHYNILLWYSSYINILCVIIFLYILLCVYFCFRLRANTCFWLYFLTARIIVLLFSFAN